ncbi:hypothetical protein CsSME_00015135 [Camellia sinensis var. sinensis]
MQGYDRDDYEDLDEYEEDGEEQEEDGIGEGEYEEEEAPQTTQEELEYLELRQRLKEAIRKQIKKESGSGHANSQEKKKKLPYDKSLILEIVRIGLKLWWEESTSILNLEVKF